VLPIEDTCYRGWKPETMMLYDSALTQNDFHRLYGRLPNEDVMVYAFPQLCFPTETERWTARQQLVGPAVRGQVLGYLGGLNDRKGWRRLVAALEGACDTFLLMGGSNSQGFEAAGMRGRMKGIGLTSDVRTFYHACDAFIVPSHYEPLGLVAFEAAAHGVPVIATEEVGALPHLLEYGTGVAWDGAEPLAPLVQSLAAQRSLSNAAAERMESELGEREYGAKLISAYQGAMERKRRMGSKPLPTTAGSRCQRI
jgi:glycosyltransferase involved in cell wall biosynthesis